MALSNSETEGHAIVRPGDELPKTHKTVFQRALAERRFSSDSIHNDEYTKGQGYPGALVSAYVLAGYVSELLVNYFGESWLTTGKFKLNFVGKGVQQGDPITCGGVVTSVEELSDGRRRVVCDVYMEKAEGVRPVIGQASGVV